MTADATGSTDGHLARAALPTLGDLDGWGWLVDETDDGPGPGSDDDGPAGALLGACLPGGFPDDRRLAEAEVAFVRPGTALVVALASVFHTHADAAEAWAALIDEEFARRFAEAIAAEVTAEQDADPVAGSGHRGDGPSAAIELLGPVVGASDFRIERGGVRTAQQRAVFAGARDDAVTPVVLHGAVTSIGRTVVLVWAVDAGTPAEDEAWHQLVARVEDRASSANLLDR